MAHYEEAPSLPIKAPSLEAKLRRPIGRDGMRRRRIISSSGKQADVRKEFGMIPLMQVVPLTRHSIPR